MAGVQFRGPLLNAYGIGVLNECFFPDGPGTFLGWVSVLHMQTTRETFCEHMRRLFPYDFMKFQWTGMNRNWFLVWTAVNQNPYEPEPVSTKNRFAWTAATLWKADGVVAEKVFKL